MPRINSTYEDFPRENIPSAPSPKDVLPPPNYQHGIDQVSTDTNGLFRRKTGVPVAFQVTSPFDFRRVLLPHALVMHVSPNSLDESLSKKKEVIQTRGGHVEQHWGDEMSDMSIQASTGSFMNINTGLTSVLRERTIAYDRYLDLKDLFENNGSVFDPYGNVVLQGKIMLMYDRGTYIGHFTTFKMEETDDSPFAFQIDMSFKIEQTILQIPASQLARQPRPPSFQYQNSIGNRFEGDGNSTLVRQLDTAEEKARIAELSRKNADETLALAGKSGEEWRTLFSYEGAANKARQEADAAQDAIGTNPGLPTRSE